MLAWLSGILSVALVITLIELWMEIQEKRNLQKDYRELLKYSLAKQDSTAYTTAYPPIQIDKAQQEEEQKSRREILEFNNIMLRDSVRDGISEQEAKRFGIMESAGIIS